MHNTIRFNVSLSIAAMAIAMSGCVSALKVSAVGRSATAAAEIPAMVSPPVTVALPAVVDEILIVRRGSSSDGVDSFPVQFLPDNDNVVVWQGRIKFPAYRPSVLGVPDVAQPMFNPELDPWKTDPNFPSLWKNQFPRFGLNDHPNNERQVALPALSGTKIRSEKQITKIIKFFNARIYWRTRSEPIGTRPLCPGPCVPQPAVAIYFLNDGRVISSRGLSGYELWAKANNDSLYQRLRFDEIRELQELGIRHEVK